MDNVGELAQGATVLTAFCRAFLSRFHVGLPIADIRLVPKLPVFYFVLVTSDHETRVIEKRFNFLVGLEAVKNGRRGIVLIADSRRRGIDVRGTRFGVALIKRVAVTELQLDGYAVIDERPYGLIDLGAYAVNTGGVFNPIPVGFI